jgi:sortase (surface protein transpeptidase)
MSLPMPRSRRLYATVALVLFAFIGAAGMLVLQKPTPRASVRTASVVDTAADLKLEQAAVISVAPSPEPVTPAVAQPPGRLIIRSIGVNAPVVGVGVDNSGAMAVTSTSFETGWYKLGPAPGDPGDAVIDGHLDWYDTSRAVFYNLKDLQLGDDIEVQRMDGVSHHFRVTTVQSVAYNATVPGLFATTGPARLSLITCGGSWSTKLGQYLQRVVVDSTMVS